jgi:hypothetical protein
MAPGDMAPGDRALSDMAPIIMPQASQTQSCPLLKLPPEVRSRIYAYTHALSLDLDLTGDGCDNLSKAWESTPLSSTLQLPAASSRAKLATTTVLCPQAPYNEGHSWTSYLPVARIPA